MTHIPHKLTEDFPELFATITWLKSEDTHFARLLEAYDDLNRQVHRAETLVEPLGELAETELHKRRAVLKDELYRLLRAAETVDQLE